MKDQRRAERRSFEPSPPFPLVDKRGQLVVVDRRFMADRRLNNISVSNAEDINL